MDPALQTGTTKPVHAPYGRACVACAKAKAKCFYFDTESRACMRCERLQKACEASVSVRKRKGPSPPAKAIHKPQERTNELVVPSRDQDLINNVQAYPTPSVSSAFSPDGRSPGPKTPGTGYVTSWNEPVSAAPKRSPDVALDPDSTMVHFVRSEDSATAQLYGPGVSSQDVSINISDAQAHEYLESFRQIFLPQFPFTYISPSTSHRDLRSQKPFLWLNIMALGTRRIAETFAWEKVIWRTITEKAITQHETSLDLLLGLICFASWNHYYKQNRPFMTMLTQIAVAMALELNLHKDVVAGTPWRPNVSNIIRSKAVQHRPRTLEERRTIVALFHLTSATWTAYRKTEPLKWSPYLDECLNELGYGLETLQDKCLAAQVRCLRIINEVASANEETATTDSSDELASFTMLTFVLGQLETVRQSLHVDATDCKITRMYLHSTECTVRDAYIRGLGAPADPNSVVGYKRFVNLNETLRTIERWMKIFFDMSPAELLGISVDIFSQFTKCLVVLYKLTLLSGPNRDNDDFRERANVFTYLDRAIEVIMRIPAATGVTDADGPRKGLAFKAPYLLQAIRVLFVRGLEQQGVYAALPAASNSDMPILAFPTTAEGGFSERTLSEDFLASLSEETWLSDVFGTTWTMTPDQFEGFGVEALPPR